MIVITLDYISMITLYLSEKCSAYVDTKYLENKKKGGLKHYIASRCYVRHDVVHIVIISLLFIADTYCPGVLEFNNKPMKKWIMTDHNRTYCILDATGGFSKEL